MDEDRILEEIKRDPQVETSLGELLKVNDVKDSPGWKYMHERFRGYRKVVANRFAARLLIGQDISEKEIHFARGYAAAVEDVFAFPERVEQNFEKAAERAWERLQDQGAVSDEIPTP